MNSILVTLIAMTCTFLNVSPDHPTDAFTIGVKQFIWEDEQRVDDYYGGNRIVNVQVWYPAIDKEQPYEVAPYYFGIDKAFSSLEGWTKTDLKMINSVQTNSFLDLEIIPLNRGFPLVMFSPMLGGNLSLYTFFAERLAQEGYIVMGINHLYESEFVLTAADLVLPANLTFHDSLKNLSIPDQITAEAYRANKGLRHKVLGEDVIFSLNQLLKNPFFKDHIDTTRIGAFGHSIGGAAVIYASLLDDRIDAVIDLDGTPPSVALENGMAVPFLFIEDLIDYNHHKGYAKVHQRRNDFCALNRQESWRIMIGGIHHNSFLDINYALAEGQIEKEKAYKVLDHIGKYMENFFKAQFFAQPLNLQPVKTDSLEIIRFEK